MVNDRLAFVGVKNIAMNINIHINIFVILISDFAKISLFVYKRVLVLIGN
jgi:hypothetical protein